MNHTNFRTDAHGPSFLPEDYLRNKAERRSTLLGFTLFCVVMFAVVAAFFVTNRQWSTVKGLQEDINRQYTQEAKKIEQLKVLEAQKTEMLGKAEITTALLERVPRSILLAELINRMPDQLTLTDLKLVSKQIREQAPAKPAAAPQGRPKSLAGKGADPKAKEPPPKPRPPRFEYNLELVGLARSDEEVADYHASLKACQLIERVDLAYSTAVTIDDVSMRKFRIEARIREDADARRIEPLHVPRLGPLPGLARPGAGEGGEYADAARDAGR